MKFSIIGIGEYLSCNTRCKVRFGYYRDPISRSYCYYPTKDDSERGYHKLCAPIYAYPNFEEFN